MCSNLADSSDFNQMIIVEQPQVKKDNDESSSRDTENDTTDEDIKI